MAQEIRNRRGNLVVSIPDGVVLMPTDPTVSSDGPTLPNNNTSLFQIGRDVLDYGLEVSENLHWLMENFANATPPGNPVDGQLWWDLSSLATPTMRVFDTNTGGWGSLVRLASDTDPTLSANMNASGRKITNLGAPSSAQDAVTKQYVDNALNLIGGGSTLGFIGLSDTPITYSGQSGKTIRVNPTSTGLEFYKLKFTDLDGVPGSLSGNNGKYLRVNASGLALEYTTPNISHIDWSGITNINAQGVRIGNIAAPINANDATTKQYVDTTAASIISAALPSSDGIVVKTGANAQARSIVAGNDGITVANGNGVGGNISVSHKPSGTQSSVNSGQNIIQSIQLDSYGHISGIGTTTISNSLGFTPVNKAGDTMTGNLVVNGSGRATLLTTGDISAHRGNNTGTLFLGNANNRYLHFDGSNYVMPGSNLFVNGGQVWSSTNQGPGTGMNSDLLDGYDWTSGQNVSLGIVQAKTPNLSTTGGVRIDANPGSQTAILQFTNNNYTDQLGFIAVGANGTLTYNNGTVWHSLNDGPGSGLEADLLDGYHAADLIAAAKNGAGGIISGRLSANGWARFGYGNLMIQWGRSSVSHGYTITFPVAFSSVFSLTLGSTGQYFDDSRGANCWVNGLNNISFVVGGQGSIYYIAIGV